MGNPIDNMIKYFLGAVDIYFIDLGITKRVFGARFKQTFDLKLKDGVVRTFDLDLSYTKNGWLSYHSDYAGPVSYYEATEDQIKEQSKNELGVAFWIDSMNFANVNKQKITRQLMLINEKNLLKITMYLACGCFILLLLLWGGYDLPALQAAGVQ